VASVPGVRLRIDAPGEDATALILGGGGHGHAMAAAPRSTTVEDCRRVRLPTERTPGVLTVAGAVPFPVRRVYWIHGVPPGGRRGAHAHRALWQSFHAPCGSFDLHLDDGLGRACFRLADPAVAVVVPPMIWRDLDHFSEGAICAVLASEPFDPDDYLRDYDDFRRAKGLG
jgi:hypothetical protein